MGLGLAKRIMLKTLSFPSDIDLDKSYRLERTLTKVRHLPISKAFYTMWDHELIVDGHSIPVRIFEPPSYNTAVPPAVIIYFHGGGWVSGNIDSYTNTCANLSKKTGRIVVSVDYRLAPENPFPAALIDCYCVCSEISSDLTLFGTSDIILMGDSAGGNLAAAVSLLARDFGGFKPKKQVLIYPATYNDHSESSPFLSTHENGSDFVLTTKRINEYMNFYASCEDDKQSCYFAPLLARSFDDLPETLLITAEFDPLRDEGEELGRRLNRDGTKCRIYRIPGTIHGFFNKNAAYKPVREVVAIINNFLGRSKQYEQTKKYEMGKIR